MMIIHIGNSIVLDKWFLVEKHVHANFRSILSD